VLLVSCALWLVFNKHHALTNSATNNVNGTFTGIVTQDDCSGNFQAGDTGCSITVGSRIVTIVHGNIQTPHWGKIVGFASYTDVTGKEVTVYAVQDSPNHYSLSSEASYAKLLN
jgi:hypothetical protein